MQLAGSFFAALIAGDDVSVLLEMGKIAHLFRGPEVDLYDFVMGFVKDHHKLPHPDTVEKHTGEELGTAPEPPSYYLDLLKKRHVQFTLKAGIKEIGEVIASDPMQAASKLHKLSMSLMAAQSTNLVIDFRDIESLVMSSYAEKMAAPETSGIRLGWPTIDSMAAGFRKGDIVSFVGRPAQGKTWQMLYSAMHGWMDPVLKGKPEEAQSRVFVVMEMSAVEIAERMIAMTAHIPATKVEQGQLTSKGYGKLKEACTLIKGFPQPFYILDGSMAMDVEDLWMWVRILNPDGVWIDGGYLLPHKTERDRFKRVAENCHLLKKEVAPLSPVTVSWQFSKEAAKKAKKKHQSSETKVDLEDIGYSDAIPQISSVVLGLFQEESVETMQRRRVEILKGRKGQTGSFTTNWDFYKMDFSEYVEGDIEELVYV